MSSAEEHKTTGNEAFAAKDYAKAIEAYTKAIELDSENHIYFSNRSAAYLKAGEWNKALDDAERCLALNPDFVKGYGRKASVLHTLKRYDEAIALYEKGLEVAKAQSDEAGLKMMQEGLEHAKRAKQLQGNETVKAVHVVRASNAASLSQRRKSQTSTSVGLFVQHSRMQLQMQIQMLQAQLDLINSLAKLSDQDKLDMLFHLMDLDSDGSIDARELARSLRQHNEDLTFAESVESAINLMAIFDQDGDAKLDRNEFKVFIDHLMASLGTSFHDLAEYLVLQHILPTAISPQQQLAEALAGEMLAEDIDEEVLAREELLNAVTNPRMRTLFELFDKDGDGRVDFREVALGLYQITCDMEGSIRAAMDILLVMDPNDERILDYEQFARLILGMVAASPGQSLDQVADALTLQLTQPTPISVDDLRALLMADDVYSQCKDLIEEAKERGEVINALQYDKTQRLFDLWDTNHDGAIDFQELLLGMRKFQGASERSLDESAMRATLVMVGFDEDANQKLDRTEFARALVNYAQAMDADLHEMIDFMCVTCALKDNTEYEKAYAKAKAVEASDRINSMREMLLAEVDY